MRHIFLDTETTGLSAETGDRIIEIGCIEMVNRRLTGNNLHFYVNPERRSHEDALKVHGLTEDFLSTKPLFSAVVDELMTYVAGAEIVIHNAAFDVGFLDVELRRLGRSPFTGAVGRITDSWLMARELFPGKANSLDALCRRLEVDNTSRTLHGALLDAGLLAEVYINMTRGQNSLVIDVGETHGTAHDFVAVDFSAYVLPVLTADEDELLAHEGVLLELDRASGGKTRWRHLSG